MSYKDGYIFHLCKSTPKKADQVINNEIWGKKLKDRKSSSFIKIKVLVYLCIIND